MSILNLGAQLYTLRDFTKDEASFADTMKKVADIGYKSVQVSGTGPLRPQFIADVAKDTGLKVVLTHTPLDRMLKETETVIEEHSVFGCDGMGVGGLWCPSDYDGIMRKCEEIAPMVEKIKAAGKVFLMHNHRGEFEKINGKYMIEHLLENTDPEGFKLTFDTYWATAAGVDPAKFIMKYGDRIYATHLKDMTVKKNEVVMTEMLTGNIDFDPIMKASAEKGLIWHMIEQDQVYIDVFESMKISYNNIMNTYAEYFK